MRDRCRAPLVSALGLLTVATASNVLAAPSADAVLERCASTAERAQQIRLAGRLLEAREELRVCAVVECPTVVQQDCVRWLSEIDRDLPSSIFRARDARGRDVVGVRVVANGRTIQSELDGNSVALDPGEYALRFEARSGAVATRTVLMRLGEQRREIIIRFREVLESDGSPARSAPVSSLQKRRHQGSSPFLAYAFGSVGVVSLGAFTYFELRGQSRYRDLRDSCGRTHSCPEERVDSTRTDFVLAGSFLAISAVCLGISTWQFLRPTSPAVRSAFRSSRPHRTAREAAIWHF